MQAAQRLMHWVADRGFEVRRHRAKRRVQLMLNHGVDHVLDVGASVGHYAEELRRFGYQGKISSFEPQHAAYEQLAALASADPTWSTYPVALGDTVGESVMNIAANVDSSSLLPMLARHTAAAPAAAYVGTEAVQLQTLDAIAEDVLATMDGVFLKIDTQGYERRVLDGAAATLAQIVGVQLELSFVPLYDGGMLVDEAIVRMRAAGFTLMRIEPGFTDAANGQMLQADGVFFRD